MFGINDRIVCVDASMQEHTKEELLKDVPNWIEEGKEYTVRGFGDYDFVVGVYLEEVVNPPKYFSSVKKFVEPSFRIDRFRKKEPVKEEVYGEFETALY